MPAAPPVAVPLSLREADLRVSADAHAGSVVVPSDLADGRTRMRRWTVDEYEALDRLGFFSGDRQFELLDGVIVRKDRSDVGDDPMTVGYDHMLAVKLLATLDGRCATFGCHLQTQLPVVIPTLNEPEPDGAILRGTPRDYAGRKPGPEDILCVIEVSSSSLALDRGRKLRGYANAGIPQYVVENLPERVVEVYADPRPGTGRYATMTPHRTGTIALNVGDGRTLDVDAADLLP